MLKLPQKVYTSLSYTMHSEFTKIYIYSELMQRASQLFQDKYAAHNALYFLLKHIIDPDIVTTILIQCIILKFFKNNYPIFRW